MQRTMFLSFLLLNLLPLSSFAESQVPSRKILGANGEVLGYAMPSYGSNHSLSLKEQLRAVQMPQTCRATRDPGMLKSFLDDSVTKRNDQVKLRDAEQKKLSDLYQTLEELGLPFIDIGRSGGGSQSRYLAYLGFKKIPLPYLFSLERKLSDQAAKDIKEKIVEADTIKTNLLARCAVIEEQDRIINNFKVYCLPAGRAP